MYPIRWLVFAFACCSLSALLQGEDNVGIPEFLESLDTTVLEDHGGRALMLSRAVEMRFQEANHRSSAEWRDLSSRQQWEGYRDRRIDLMRQSLGSFPEVTGSPRAHITGRLFGEGYRIENLIFESRPNFWVTANLYLPDPAPDSMPGILICHSHHNPKTQGELQDMGMTWARWGCMTLVMDQVGHGERRDHPFQAESDYSGPFRVGRQDYYFRYNLGIQLHLIGESLIGWMVWDLMRGVDLLLERKGIDSTKIILLGAVAGGGDPAAVTAALDQRIAAVVPLNFGGPQGYHPFPLPEDSVDSFAYAGTGSWESTRNLRLSARDGFLPWLIVGAVAPRPLVYAHEFSWDRERDPVWPRLQRIYGDFYSRAESLDYSHGFGTVRKRPPEASHCNNIGPVQRERVHLAFQRWFGIKGSREGEYSHRLAAAELLCMGIEWREHLQPRRLHEEAMRLGQKRRRVALEQLGRLQPELRRKRVQERWAEILGKKSERRPSATLLSESAVVRRGIRITRVILETDSEILVPVLILAKEAGPVRRAGIVCVAQGGKKKFLRQRNSAIASLLEAGVTVCLIDVRGTGESDLEGNRGRTGAGTELSSSILMLGETLVGGRLGDLRAVLAYLRDREDIAANRLAVWGDSLAVPNQNDDSLLVPMGAGLEPAMAEPLGGILGFLAALFEDDLVSVYAYGGLIAFESTLNGPFCYIPHDVVIPGAIPAGDLPLLAKIMRSTKLRLDGLVDGMNCKVESQLARRDYDEAVLGTESFDDLDVAGWLLKSLGVATASIQ